GRSAVGEPHEADREHAVNRSDEEVTTHNGISNPTGKNSVPRNEYRGPSAANRGLEGQVHHRCQGTPVQSPGEKLGRQEVLFTEMAYVIGQQYPRSGSQHEKGQDAPPDTA